ncbi:hypothetical protein OEZ85_000244 [Tetradesmus obliquus]|uniref:Bacterial surface antigen (D15) domain-containing protein n=1 Tax=Tetradesmus obliquus TaxID=3088 RepID=A0ABY8UPZ9_TETOB|nr:hypothetical protein OEZ85_000244 [Tetradesmus obliquus]
MQPAADELAPAGSSLVTSFTTADANGLTSRTASKAAEGAFAGQPSFSLGPIDLHAGSLVRQFRVRQKFSLSDNLEAAAGLAYDFKSQKVGPTGSLIYRLDPDNKKSRIELSTTDKKLLLRKGWQVKIKQATVGVSAEASLSLQDPHADPGSNPKLAKTSNPSSRSSNSFVAGLSSISSSMHPDLHLSLDYVKPLKYELIGIGLVLLLNMPLKLNNKEAEFGGPWGSGALKGFARGSVKRAGFMRWQLAAQEGSAVLDI